MMDTGLLFAVISPFLASIATILLAGTAKLFPPFIILSFAPLIGASILIPLFIFRGGKFRIKEIKENSRDLFFLITVRQVVGWTLFVIGLSFTTGIKAIFLTKVEPYIVLYFHWLFKKEPIKARHLFLLAIHISGAVLLSTGGRFEGLGRSQFGDLFIVGAIACTALTYIPATNLSRKIGGIKTNSLMLLFAGLLLLPFALFVPSSINWANQTGWVYLIGYSILFSTVGLTLWFISLKTVKGWIVSALRALGPLVGAPFAYFLLGETLSLTQIFGGVVVLATSFLIAREHLHGGSNS